MTRRAGLLNPQGLCRAVDFGAVGIDVQRVVVDPEAALFGNFGLALFDIGVVELLDAPALQAYQVVVVPALVELVDRLAAFEMMPHQQPRLLELRQHAVHRRQAGVGAFLEQYFVDVFGRQMAHLAFLEQLEDAQPRQRRFEADGLEIAGGTHAGA